MRLLILIASMSFGAPAFADDVCHEAWFLRNLIMDRAGYCFGSALGQSVFDNSDCTGKSVVLPAEDEQVANKIRSFEDWFGCSVPTGSTFLDLPYADLLRRLDHLPIPTDTGSGCMGWTGREIPLYAGHNSSSAVLGSILPGDSIVFDYDFVSPMGWAIVSVVRNETVNTIGWTDQRIEDAYCSMVAG